MGLAGRGGQDPARPIDLHWQVAGAETFGLLGLFIGPALMTVLTMLWNEWVA